MARPELGVKRICPTTGKKFYDLNRDPIVSPYTGEVLQRAIFEPARRSGPLPAAPKVVPATEDDEVELETADAELISLEEADDETATPAKVVVEDEIEIEDDGAVDDTFLEEDEDDAGDDVIDLIGDGLPDEEDQ